MRRRRNPDARIRELERRALHDLEAAHAYARELDRLGQRQIDLPGAPPARRVGGLTVRQIGGPKPAYVVFHPGTPENPTGWYIVAGNGTWSRDRWDASDDALIAARMIEHINRDGSVYLRESGSYCSNYIPHGTGGTCTKRPGHRGQCTWTRRRNPTVADRALYDAELRDGTTVELEHTRSRRKAAKIALDHMREDPHYYAKLRAVGMNPDEDRRRRERDARAWQDPASRQAHEAAAGRVVTPTYCERCGRRSDDYGECGSCANCNFPLCAHLRDAPDGNTCPSRFSGVMPIRHYAPWRVDGRGERWSIVHSVTGARRRGGSVHGRAAQRNFERARDLANRLNDNLSDAEVLAAFIRHESAVGKNLISHGTTLETSGMGATTLAHNDGTVIHEYAPHTRLMQRVLRALRRAYREAAGEPGPVIGYQEAPGSRLRPRRGNPAPLAVMGLGPLPLGLLNPDVSEEGPGEVGHGPRHKELQPKYTKELLTPEQAKGLLVETYGAERAEEMWQAAIERTQMWNGTDQAPEIGEAYTYDDGKDEHTVIVGPATGIVPESHYIGVGDASNKKGQYWVHKHKKGNEPLEMVDPATGITFKFGGEFRVTDWYREKKKNT